MSGRRRQGLSPSLFPFLAVLVCTLGTLILLLALVAQNATDTAQQAAQAEQQAADQVPTKAEPDLPRLERGVVDSMLEEEHFRVAQLVAFRDKQTADVEARRDQLTHMEDHVRRLKERLKLLNTEVELATGGVPTNVLDQSMLDDLKKEIAEQELALADLREEAEDDSPRVVIVPHKGPNGTERRPIYIECDKDGVIVWPEGSRIDTLHLEESFANANPLDGALRAIRYHALQKYGDSTPPYPLLVVRPDGIESYSAARRAMEDWDDQFGYELVPQDVRLAFPDADPALKQRIDLAIREAAARQHARHAIASRAARQSRRRLPTLSAASLDRQGRAGGYRPLRDPAQIRGGGAPYLNRPTYSSGSSYAASGHAPGGQGSSEAVRRLDSHLRDAADELRQQEQAGTPSLDVPPSLPVAGTAGRPFSGTATEAIGGAPEASSLRDQTTAKGGGLLPGSGGTTPPEAPPEISSNNFADVTPPARNNPFALPDQTGSGLRQGDDKPLQSFANDDLPNEESGAPSEAMASGEMAKAINVEGAMNRGDSSKGGDPSGPTPPADPTSNGRSQHAAAMGAMKQAPQIGSGNPSPQSSPSNQAGPPQGSPPPDMVRREGRDWALPSNVAGARGTAIIRTIRVQCYADRFVLLPPGGGGATEMFGYSDGEINRATLQLATAVRDRVARWGAALPGGRWQPRLDVEVMPRGEARFHQLRTLMNGSGVDVQGRSAR